MAVACPRCQRAYDVTLFAFGRTIHCTCGARVGLEPQVRQLAPAGPAAAPHFLADAMLGRLARWLRLLGIDCAYEAHVSDEALVRRGVEEGRIILTRDRRLPEEWRVQGIEVLAAEDTHAQLVEVLKRHDLAGRVQPFTRCSACNEPLVAAEAADVAGRVPPRVRADPRRFRACPACGRVYWEGSHVARMRRVAARLLAEAERA